MGEGALLVSIWVSRVCGVCVRERERDSCARMHTCMHVRACMLLAVASAMFNYKL
jgi:hypothetical protein